MLTGLDDIDWQSLEHAYGTAADVPEFLRGLASADGETRGRSRYWLGANIHHQGTVYSATAPAVPFLLELAASPAVAERAWIVAFLTDLAMGEHRQWLRRGFNVTLPGLSHYFEGEEAEPFLRAYEAVERGVPALLGLLADGDAEVRMAAAFTLSWFARHAREIRDAAAAALLRERDARATASLLVCLSLQDAYLDERAQLETVAARLGDGPEGWVAAIALHHYGVTPHLEAAFARLREALLALPAYPGWEGFPWAGGDLPEWALQTARGHFGTPELTVLLFELVERVTAPGDGARERLAQEALPTLFGALLGDDPAPAQADGLGADQRRFLEDVVRRPWLAAGGFWEAMGKRGLPDDPRALRRWLGVAEPPGPLDTPLTAGGETRPLRDWAEAGLGAEDPRLGALADAIAGLEDPVAAAFAAHVRGLRAEATFAAVERADPARVLAGALPLAREHGVGGPALSYARMGTQIHHPANVLLLAAATAACASLGSVPDEAFDALMKSGLGHEYWRPRVDAYMKLVPPARLTAFFTALVGAGWRSGWKQDHFPISTDEKMLRWVIERVEPAARAGLLLEIARQSGTVALPFVAEAPALIEVLASPVARGLDEMSHWAREDVEGETERRAVALAAAGLAGWPYLRAAEADATLPARGVFTRARELVEAGSPVMTAMRDARVGRDGRGLVPLDDARRRLAGVTVYRKGEGEMREGTFVLESDELWAALLSLEDAAEFVRQATRLRWDFHVRGRDNTALVERYGAGILPWLETRLDGDLLVNVPWCVLPCLLALDGERALELALRAGRVTDEDGDDLAVARRWIDRDAARYPTLGKLAGAGNEKAERLLRDRGAALGDVVREALGPDGKALADRLELPASTLPPEVVTLLAASSVVDEPRGPVWGIAAIDQAAAAYELPLWDNLAYTTAAMRVTGFASRHGDVLALQHVYHHPGASEPASVEVTAFGPGAGRRSANKLLLPGSEVETQWFGNDTTVNGVSNEIEVFGDHDEDGTYIDGSRGRRVVAVPMPFDHLILEVAGKKVDVVHRLPEGFAAGLDDEERKALRLVTPSETLLVALCARHREVMLPGEDELRRAIGVPDGAVKLFSFDDFEHPSAGEPASSSADWVTMVAALRARRKLTRLPGDANTRPERWLPAWAGDRCYGGADAWAASDGPVDEPRPEGPGTSPYDNLLLARGWPHGLQLMHDPGHHAPGSPRLTAEYLVGQPGPVLRVFWPRAAAALYARAVAGAEERFASGDAGVERAMTSAERFLHVAEARRLVARFVASRVVLPPHAGGFLPLILEALAGGDVTVRAFADALAALPEEGWRDRPALAAALHELGFVLRRLAVTVPFAGDDARVPEEDRGQLLAALRAVTPFGESDVARALTRLAHGRAGAARAARAQADYAHVDLGDDDARDWVRARILDPATAPSPPDAWLVTLAGDALLEQYASRAADVADPVWAATQLAMFASPRATEALAALRAAHPAAAPDIVKVAGGRLT